MPVTARGARKQGRQLIGAKGCYKASIQVPGLFFKRLSLPPFRSA